MSKLNQMVETLDMLTISESEELVSILENKWNVKASVELPVILTQEVSKVESKTEFTVELKAFGTQKINVIKAIRDILGLPLKDSKDLVEKAPVYIKEGISEDAALELKRKLEEAGATVDVL